MFVGSTFLRPFFATNQLCLFHLYRLGTTVLYVYRISEYPTQIQHEHPTFPTPGGQREYIPREYFVIPPGDNEIARGHREVANCIMSHVLDITTVKL
eukprot:6003093-Pyramimonas_sp.AAC.2